MTLLSARPCVTLTQLPDTALLHVVQFLAKDDTLIAFKCTCWRLHLLLESVAVWRCERLAVHAHRLRAGVVRRALASSPCLRRLDLTGCVQATDEFVYHVALCQPSLSEVILTGCVLVSDRALAVLQRHLAALACLSISGCRLVSCGALVALARRHRLSLTHLDVSDSLGLLTDRYRVADLAAHLPRLRSLAVSWSTRYGRTLVLHSDLTRLATACPLLTRLDAAGAHVHARTLAALAAHCPALARLNLANCFVRCADFARVGQRLRRLRHVDISGCTSLQESGLAPAHHRLYRLTHLDVSRCFALHDETTRELLSALTQLRELLLRDCFNVTEAGIAAAFTHRRLALLDVSGTRVSRRYVAGRPARNGLLRVITDRCPARRHDDGIMWT